MRYETREALELLAKESMRLFKPRDVSDAAGMALLMELGALGSPCVRAHFDDGKASGRRTVQFGHSDTYANVWFTKQRGYFHITINDQEVPIEGIVYDAAEDIFKTDLVDDSIVPLPGQPLPRRSPLAVIVSAVLEVLRNPPPPKAR